MARFSAAMFGVTDRTEVGDALLETVARVSGALDGLVALVEPQTEKLTNIGSFGFPRDDALERGRSRRHRRTPIRDAAPGGRPIVIELPRFLKRYGKLASMVLRGQDRSRVAFPLRTADANIGGVTLRIQASEFDENELDFFMSLANAAAHALERLRLSEAEREAREMLDTVVAQMPVGVTIAGRDGRPLYRNAALDRIMLGRDVAGPAVDAWTGLRPDGARLGPGDWPGARSAMATGNSWSTRRSGRKGGRHGGRDQPDQRPGDRCGGRDRRRRRTSLSTLPSARRRSSCGTPSGRPLARASDAGHDHLRRRSVPRGAWRAARPQRSEGTHGRHRRRIRERLDRMVDDLLVLARAERGVDLTAHGAAWCSTDCEPWSILRRRHGPSGTSLRNPPKACRP